MLFTLKISEKSENAAKVQYFFHTFAHIINKH